MHVREDKENLSGHVKTVSVLNQYAALRPYIPIFQLPKHTKSIVSLDLLTLSIFLSIKYIKYLLDTDNLIM